MLEQSEGEYWRTRLRSNWLAYGDKKTMYFHHHASKKKAKNHIASLKDNLSQVHEDRDEIDNIAVHYFCSLLKVNTPCMRYKKLFAETDFHILSEVQNEAIPVEF